MQADFPTLPETRLPCLRSSFAALVSNHEIEFSRPAEAMKSFLSVLYSSVRTGTLIEGEKEVGVGS